MPPDRDNSDIEGYDVHRASIELVLLALSSAILALFIAGLALVGYVLRLPLLYSIRPGLEAMSPLTALAFASVAFADLALIRHRPRAAIAGAALALAIGGAVLVSHLVAQADVLSPVFVTRLFGPVIGAGRTSGGTALAIVALALACLPIIRARPVVSDYLAAVAMIIAAFALVGYAYGAADLYSLALFSTMAINTGVTTLLLSATAIFSQRQGGWAATIGAPGGAGEATRRQLLFALLPPVMGLVLIRAIDAQLLRIGAAMTMLVVLTIVPLGWLVLRDGKALAALDRERERRKALEASYLYTLETRLRSQAAELQALNAAALANAEAASLQSSNRYQQLFNSIDAGFCVIEMQYDSDAKPIDFRILERNEAFCANISFGNPAGKWMRELDPALEQHWYDIYGQVASTRQPRRFEMPGKTPGNRWYDIYAYPIDDPALNRVAVLFNDITARHRSFAELAELNASLEQRVNAAVAEIETANAELRQAQKMEAMGKLMGGVAHDFNNLLTPILGSLDLLNRRGIGSEREQRLISGALQSAERARVLVQRLLAFARRQPLQPGPVDLGNLVRGMDQLIASTTGPQIRLFTEVETGLPLALADANQIEMALLNLCVNARDAMPDGGQLTVRLAADDPAARQEFALAPGDYLRLSVIDTGAGMDAATRERAIEPFFSTKGIGKGTGLGLSMVDGLLAQLGGGMSIESAPGAGTQVDLWIPESSVPMSAPLAPPAKPIEKRQGRVLVVDDEEEVRLATADMLEDMGYEITQAASAEEAHAILHAQPPFNLVVTDHLMPHMTGVELSHIIRETWPETRVLLISGYAETAGVPADLARLTKPFRQAELAQAMAAFTQDSAGRSN